MSLDDDLRRAFLTSELTDAQRAELLAAGEEVHFAPGDELFHEGRPADHLWMLLDGRIELSRRAGNQTMVVATMSTPGQWAGGLAAWAADEHAVYRASGRALDPGRCFRVSSDDLGRLVSTWSPFARHMITGVYQTVRGIDAAARQRESLIALGTLAAGLAHEINNPAAASLRAVESLRNTSGYMLASLVSLAEHGILAEQFLALDQVRSELQGRPLTDESALARADREEVIGTWLEDHEVQFAWQMAPLLASRGVDERWLAGMTSLVGEDSLTPALRWITSTIGALALLDELGDATQRIAHLVEDVKTYSQMDRAALQRADLTVGLESTLAILGPKLDGVEVVRDYAPDVPEIEVFAAELNQVWTNLIDNAVDAMSGHGTLRISTRLDGDHVVVEICDTGCGIDPDITSHVFEPFFTTKDVGKGTGLGLDISRRIVVDRHGGDIALDSTPEGTTARVSLPIRA